MKEIILVKGNNMEEITRSVISLISNSLTENNIIIVPDRYSLIVESMLFDVLNISATFNIKVMGINKLAKSIIKECGLDDFSFTKEQSLLLVRRAISECADKFICFKKQLSVGFCEEIFSSITQFKTNKLSSSDVREIAENSPSLSAKMTDLAMIYECYEKYLNGRLDSAEVLNVFESQIENSNLIRETNFFFVGFDSFTKQGYSLLTTLANYSPKVVVGAPEPKNQKNKFLFDNEVVNNIKNFANEKGVLIKNVECYGNQNLINKHIINNLYLGEVEVLKTDKQPVVISECFGIDEEIHFVIKTIKDLLKKGYSFKDFNIACRLTDYSKELKREFKKMEYSFYLDETINLYSIYPIRQLIKILQFFCDYFDKNFFELLKNDYIFDDIDLVEELENISLKRNIKFPKVLDYDFELEEDNKQKINITFSKFKTLFEEFKNSKNIENYIEFIKKIIKIFDFETKIQEKTEFLNNFDLKNQKIYLQVLTSLTEVFEDLDLIKNQEVSANEFLELIVFALKNKNISTVPLEVNSIFIGDGESGFFERRKFLFVLGANQGSLPSALNDCGVISDREIEELKDKVQISPTIAMINRRKRFKVYDLLSLFENKLFVSYLCTNSDGSKNFPSTFVDGLLKMFESEKGEYKIHNPNKDLYFADYEVSLENFVKLKYNLTNFSSLKLALSKLLKDKKFEMAKLLYSVANKIEPTFMPKIKTTQIKPYISNAKELFFKNSSTKISQLERYFHCPYAHFMDYGLKLKPRETGRIEAKDIGTILHTVAEKFCKYNIKTLGYMTDEEVNTSLNKIIKELFKSEENSWLEFSENKYLAILLEKEARNLCLKLNSQQKVSLFRPKYFEKRFFENSEFKPLQIKDLNLIGVVDRIDTYKDSLGNEYFRVIDYKTGKIESGFASVYFGDKIQLFIYQRAIEQNLKMKPAGNLYYSIKDQFESEKQSSFNMEGVLLNQVDILTKMDTSVNFDKPESDFLPFKISTSKDNIKNGELVPHKSTSLISSEDFDNISNYVVKLVEKAVDEILSGYIQTNPVKDSCKYCSYKNSCGFSTILGNRERKQSSKNVNLESFTGGADESKC